MEKKIDYSIGLDIGTNSVGWCVTDLENNILKRKQKLLRGVRLFDSANTAASTRGFRSARRRLERKKQRIKLLQELMAKDVLVKDSTFYLKLNETRKWLIDRKDQTTQYNIFKELEFNDQDYYKQYPTIYHLREELISSAEKKDIRLVYLAIHHIIKYRGNFLYEGQEFSKDDNNMLGQVEELIEYLQEQDILLNEQGKEQEICDILKNKKTNKSEKVEQIRMLFVDSKNDILKNVCGLIVGNKIDLNKIFDIGEEKKISLSEEINEEELSEYLGEKQSEFNIIRNLHSSVVLDEILDGVDYISDAFIKKYDKYKKDLKVLKKVYKDYISDKYSFMFRKEGADKKTYYTFNKRNVYGNKRHKCASKKADGCTLEELYKTISKDIENLDNEDAKYIKEQIDKKTFLVKLNTVANSTIPYQLHKAELEKIIDNQSQYYETLKENKEKIISLLEFRVPYYVGPLGNFKTRFSWAKRKEEGKIYPWNFEEKIDLSASAEEFITRMTNKCTYLPQEDVIPKNSLLYSEFCVLNEISNLRVTVPSLNLINQKIGKDAKKAIIEKLFKKNKKITVKKLKQFLISEQYYKATDIEITGFAKENEFASTLSSYIDFTKILGSINERNINMIEEIIYWRTVFETKDILQQKIKEKYPELTLEQVKQICSLKYSGWSRLSRKLLAQIKSVDNRSIMELLREEEYNFMQIITNKKLGIEQKIKNEQVKNDTKKIKYKMIEDLQGSPAIKRGIWQSCLIVEELVKVMGYEPKNIYIEMAREEGEKVRTISRYENIKRLYATINDDDYKAVYNELKELGNKGTKDLNERLYLYFMQNGKCMYSGQPLDISLLHTYEVDHILPRTFVKDDSFDNKALVCKIDNQTKTDHLVLDESIRKTQTPRWMQLFKYGLITKTKLDALTKNTITDKEKEGFIKRQLVETRQITKHIVNLLNSRFNDTNVFAIKANQVSQFRKKYNIVKNRDVNDFHHADDAYLLSVIGNYIDNNFKKEKSEYLYDEFISKFKKIDRYTIFKMRYGSIVEDFNTDKDNWDASKEIEKIKNNIKKREYCITKKLEERTGEFYNQTIYDKNYSSKAKIKLKKEEDVNKYGCKTNANIAYMAIIESVKKNKKKKELIGIPIDVANLIKNKQMSLEEYVESYVETNEFKIIKPKILIYQLIENENGHPYRLASEEEFKNAKQLILPNNMIEFLNKCQDDRTAEYEDAITNEKFMSEIYQYLLGKINEQYLDYKNEYNDLKTGFDKFNKLDAKEKLDALTQIITILGKTARKIDFIGKDRMGRKRNIVKDIDGMAIIDQSVTGIYERRYKVSELESSSNI